ncbi:MAG TPA: arabinofuranosidase catalytic domain-containing protein, partial [Flavisolibacter sp.]|nr:arabinofuranosidase catalytic domain-containing protein [Flavisolibacter sp.]
MAINYKAADVADDDHEKSFFTVNQYPAQASIRSPNTINTTNNRLKLFLASFLFLLGTAVISQNTLNKAGLSAASPSSGAYSMRLLSSSYAGSALQITRSSDNTTQNIGFTATGDLDTASLKTFVGINNGYVSTWYDQSGNLNNLTQATLANQPSLVASGVINRENGIPFIRFFTTPSYNSLNLAAGMTTVGHVSAVHLFASGGDGFILGHTGSYYWHSDPGSTSLINSTYASPSVQAGAGWTNGISYLPTSMPWPTTLAINEIEPSPSNNQTTWDNIGRDRTFHYTNNGGGYSELLLFNNALSTSDRQSLESNQGSYFSIATTILPIAWVSFT